MLESLGWRVRTTTKGLRSTWHSHNRSRVTRPGHLLAGRMAQSSDSSSKPQHTLDVPSASEHLVPSLSQNTTVKIVDAPDREKDPSAVDLNRPSGPSSIAQQASEAYAPRYGAIPTPLTTTLDVRPSLTEFVEFSPGVCRSFPEKDQSAIPLEEPSFTPSTSAKTVSEVYTPTERNGFVGQAPNLARLNSSFISVQSTLRKAAATFEGTPSIFRKRKREHSSARGSQEAETNAHIDELHVGEGNSGGNP